VKTEFAVITDSNVFQQLTERESIPLLQTFYDASSDRMRQRSVNLVVPIVQVLPHPFMRSHEGVRKSQFIKTSLLPRERRKEFFARPNSFKVSTPFIITNRNRAYLIV